MRALAVFVAVAMSIGACGKISPSRPRIILVHGAFEDAASWRDVADRLRSKGLIVDVPELELRSLKSDALRVKAEINRLPGPVLLVGHSWGGSVITEAAGDEQITGLIYVAATAPAQGETTNAQMNLAAPAPASGEITLGADGDLHISTKGMCRYLASGLASGQCEALARSQRSIRGSAFSDPVTASKPVAPVTYIISRSDRAIPQMLQERIAKKLQANVTRISGGHAIHRTHPDEIAMTIVQAARADRRGK